MPLDFCAIDFETANSGEVAKHTVRMASPSCDGVVVKTAGWPDSAPPGHDRFSADMNTRIHGIVKRMSSAKGWSAQLDELTAFIRDDILVAHNAGLRRQRPAPGVRSDRRPLPPYRYVCGLQVAARCTRLDSYRLLRWPRSRASWTSPITTPPPTHSPAPHIMIDVGLRTGARDIYGVMRSRSDSGCRRSLRSSRPHPCSTAELSAAL